MNFNSIKLQQKTPRLTTVLDMLNCIVLIRMSTIRPPKEISFKSLSVYQVTFFSICKLMGSGKFKQNSFKKKEENVQCREHHCWKDCLRSRSAKWSKPCRCDASCVRRTCTKSSKLEWRAVESQKFDWAHNCGRNRSCATKSRAAKSTGLHLATNKARQTVDRIQFWSRKPVDHR